MFTGFQVAEIDVFGVCDSARAPVRAAQIRRAQAIRIVARTWIIIAICSAIFTPWNECDDFVSIKRNGVWLLVEFVAIAPTAVAGSEVV
jgi:hypothetical protein